MFLVLPKSMKEHLMAFTTRRFVLSHVLASLADWPEQSKVESSAYKENLALETEHGRSLIY